MKILTVDDHEESLYLLQSLLEGSGHEVFSAGNGVEALKILEAGGIEMIISDILMPVMDGFQLCRKVRTSKIFHAIPFIVYTATYTGQQDEEVALKMGADRFIRKPCEPDVFLKTVKEVSAETAGRKDHPAVPELEDKEEITRLYNKQLVLKLEKKMQEAEQEMKARKEAEKALRESRNRLIEAQRIAGMGDFTLDVETNAVSFSEALLELLKYDKDRIFDLDELHKTVHHPEDMEKINKWFDDGMKSGKDTLPPVYYRVICRDGEIKYVRTIGIIKHDEGKPFCIFGTVLDITEHKLLEEQLKENVGNLKQARERLLDQARWLQALNSVSGEIARNNSLDSIFHVVLGHLEESFDCILAGIGLCPEDGAHCLLAALSSSGRTLARGLGLKQGTCCHFAKLLSLSKASSAPQLLNIDTIDTESLTDDAIEMIHSMRKKKLKTLSLAVIEYNSKQVGILFMLFDREYMHSEMECRFIKGMIEYLSVAIQNIKLYDDLHESYTQLKKTQQVMMNQERIKAMGQMASGIAHDINNTLVPITLYTEALMNNEFGKMEPTCRYLKTIQSAVGDIEETVRRLRSFYKREEKEEFEEVDAEQIIETAIHMTQPRWKDIPNRTGVEIELKTDIASRLKRVSANPSEMREAIINLIFNAVDAMPRGGTIDLGAYPYKKEDGEEYLVVEVTDEGNGMNEEQRNRCLEPFYTTKGEDGSGLGLAMVTGTMERHRGEIQIDSRQGEGTTIRLLFPLSLQFGGQKSCESHESLELPPLKILYVDDKPELCEILQEMLSKHGHSVEAFREGKTAVNAFKAAWKREDPFQVVITDMGMPHMDGEEVARLIKEISPGVPIILLSGWGEYINKEGELPPNIDIVLNKPPTINRLLCAVQNLLNRDETTSIEGVIE